MDILNLKVAWEKEEKNLWSVPHHFMLLLAPPHQKNLQAKVTKAFINCGIDDDVAINYTPRGLHLTVKNARNLST